MDVGVEIERCGSSRTNLEHRGPSGRDRTQPVKVVGSELLDPDRVVVERQDGVFMLRRGFILGETDRVLVVDTPESVQVERLMARDSVTREQAQASLLAQAKREARLRLADDVVTNTGLIEHLRKQVVVSELALDREALCELSVCEGLAVALLRLVVLDASGVIEVPSVRPENADALVDFSGQAGRADVEHGRNLRLAASAIREADEERFLRTRSKQG